MQQQWSRREENRRMGKIPASVIRPPPSHHYYLRSRYKDQPNRGGNEGNTEVLGDNFLCTYTFKRCQRKRLTRIESLPDDLLSEILVRIPAQDIYDHARFVCRKWHHMIHTRKFLCEHFKHVRYGLFFLDDYGLALFMTEKQGRIEISELNYKFSPAWLSCNGLFLEVDKSIISVINPITKQKLSLPCPPLRYFTVWERLLGIAYSAVSMKYKVVLPDPSFCSPYKCLILTVGVDESWREVEIGHLSLEALCLFSFRPLVTEGNLHWTRDPSLVLTLNIETEKITEIPVHIPLDVLSFGLNGGREIFYRYYLSTGRHLSMLIGCRGALWDLFEVKPETGEWRKVCNFALEVSSDHPLQVGWLKYPEVLVFYAAHTLFFYNLLTQKTDRLDTLLPTQVSAGKFKIFKMMVHKNSLCWFDGC